MANIGIIGVGVVGNALRETLRKRHKCFLFDTNKMVGNRDDAYSNAKIIFICVPTPKGKNGLDMSIMDGAISHLCDRTEDKIVVIRSTVQVGYTAKMQLIYPKNRFIFCPEFLVERNANECTANPEVLICGGDSEELCRSFARDVFVPLKQKVSIMPSAKEAEFAKIASNAMLASQVSAANECFEIACIENINWQIVATALKRIRVIGNNIDVPGPDGMCGFGGKCLPKDIDEICAMYNRAGFTSYYFEEVVRSNFSNRAMPIRRG